MCILSFIPGGIEPDIDGLLNGGISNPDGHGWAIVSDDSSHIIVGKTLNLLDALETFEDARKQNMRGPAMFHSRWATHGSISTANVHPFDVGGSALTVLGHNGILSCTPKKGDDRSDSRLFADEILPSRFRRLDKARAFTAMEQFIGSGNKLVILTVDPRYRNNGYIVNERLGNWDPTTGIWHSNYSYESTPKWWSKYVGGTGKQVETTYVFGQRSTADTFTAANRNTAAWYEECAICQYGNVGETGFCDECGTCSDCLETKSDCQCWQKIDLATTTKIHSTREEDYKRIFSVYDYDDYS